MSAFIWPVPLFADGRKPRVTDDFGFSKGRNRFHKGSDIMYPRLKTEGKKFGTIEKPFFSRKSYMPAGIPAVSIADGVVSRSERIETGIIVNVDHADDIRSQYIHLRSALVKVGDKVRQGQPLGEIWHNVDGNKLNHLHFQMRRRGKLVDPEIMLAGASVIPSPGLGLGITGLILLGVGGGYLAWKFKNR